MLKKPVRPGSSEPLFPNQRPRFSSCITTFYTYLFPFSVPTTSLPVSAPWPARKGPLRRSWRRSLQCKEMFHAPRKRMPTSFLKSFRNRLVVLFSRYTSFPAFPARYLTPDQILDRSLDHYPRIVTISRCSRGGKTLRSNHTERKGEAVLTHPCIIYPMREVVQSH